MTRGQVEHIDLENFVSNQTGVKVVHKERKNLGMTYIFIL